MWLVAINAVPGNLPVRVERGKYLVGRMKRAQIIISDATVSRRHAHLVVNSDGLHIEDLDSSNKTFVNEVRIRQSPLKVGDHLRFGAVVCALSSTPLFEIHSDDDEVTYRLPTPGPVNGTSQTVVFTPALNGIIPHLMEGLSEVEIASKLGKSRHTIHAQVRTVFEQMNVHSREELIVKLLKQTGQ